MDKDTLRKNFRLKRDSYEEKLLEKFDGIIYNNIVSCEAYKTANTIMTYVSMGSEVDTHRLIKYSLSIGKKVCVPVVVKGERILTISYISSMNDLECGAYEILEPKSKVNCDIDNIDLIIVPGLVFDKCGDRVGYGAGFYDKLLFQNNKVKMGICYDFCLIDNVMPQPHDVAMDIVVTNERIIDIWKTSKKV